MRDAQDLEADLGGDQFGLVAILATSTEEVASDLILFAGWRAPALWDDGGKVTQRYAGRALLEPAYVLFDAGGTVRHIWRTAPSAADPEAALAHLNRPLDLGSVIIVSDWPDWEVRLISEGIAAAIAYADHLGLPSPRPTTVFSYANPFIAHGLIRQEGGICLSSWLRRQYCNDTQRGGRIWLPRVDRFSAALAFAKSYVYPPGLDSPAPLAPLVLGGMTYHFALHALEHGGYGSVDDQLTYEIAAWQSSGHAWIGETIDWALTGEIEESTHADNVSLALDAESQGINQWTTRLFGVLALEWLEATPGQVINACHQHPVSDAPRSDTDQAISLLSLDLDSFENHLRRTDVIPDDRPERAIEVQFSDGSAQRVQRVYWCALTRELHGYTDGPLPWWPHSPNRGERPDCHESAIPGDGAASVTLPAGRYDLMLEVNNQPAFVGAFGITPVGIRPASLDGVLPGYRLEIDNNRIRIAEAPAWTQINVVGFTSFWPGDSLCVADQRRHWCWRWGPLLRSSGEQVYGIPEGRYWLLPNESPPGRSLALIELRDSDIEVVEQFRRDLDLIVDNEANPSSLTVRDRS